MTAVWSFAVALGVGTMLTIVAVARGRRVRRLGRCPVNANTVLVDVQVSPWTGDAVDVVGCSEFVPRTDVCCDKRCLQLGLR